MLPRATRPNTACSVATLNKLIQLTTAGDLKPGDSVIIYGDSELVIKQMTGEYRCKDSVLQKKHTPAHATCALHYGT